jgi:hypothetical protein
MTVSAQPEIIPSISQPANEIEDRSWPAYAHGRSFGGQRLFQQELAPVDVGAQPLYTLRDVCRGWN